MDGREPNCECDDPNNPDRFYGEEICGTAPCPKLQTQDPEDPFCSDWVWTGWSECSQDCGKGTQSRRVKCSNEFEDFDLDACLNTNPDSWFHVGFQIYTKDDLIDERACNDEPCPVEPYWTEWDGCRFEGSDETATCRVDIQDKAFRHRRWICPPGNDGCVQKIEVNHII